MRQHGQEAQWIPAFAGMTVRSDNRIGVDGIIPAFAGMTVRSDNRIGVDGIIPAKAGIHAAFTEHGCRYAPACLDDR